MLATQVQQSITEQTERLQNILRNDSPNNIYVTAPEVVNFVHQARQTMSIFDEPNEKVIEQLLNLLNQLEKDDETRRRRRKRSVIATTDQLSGSDSASGAIHIEQTKLDVSGDLLMSSNESAKARAQQVQQVNSSMIKLCYNNSTRKAFSESIEKT